MLATPASLLDRAPEHDIVTRFFEAAIGLAAQRGIALRIRHDMSALADLNRMHRNSWLPLIPIFDINYNDFPPGSVFWIDATNSRGETIGTYAARSFLWRASTLVEEARSLRIFYSDPAPHFAAGNFVEIPDEIPASQVAGPNACIGALWVRPDQRRNGLTKILSRICKAHACDLWQPSMCWGLVNPAHVDSGVARAFGSVDLYKGVRLHFSGLDLPAALSIQERARVIADMERAVAAGAIESSRRTVNAETNA